MVLCRVGKYEADAYQCDQGASVKRRRVIDLERLGDGSCKPTASTAMKIQIAGIRALIKNAQTLSFDPTLTVRRVD